MEIVKARNAKTLEIQGTFSELSEARRNFLEGVSSLSIEVIGDFEKPKKISTLPGEKEPPNEARMTITCFAEDLEEIEKLFSS